MANIKTDKTNPKATKMGVGVSLAEEEVAVVEAAAGRLVTFLALVEVVA